MPVKFFTGQNDLNMGKFRLYCFPVNYRDLEIFAG
jgi:hypothetical protein